MSEATFYVGDVFEQMAKLPDGSIDLIVTSPPFLALRSYLPADHPDKGKEIGSEATPAAFLSTLLALTREWRRLLAPHGSLCVELGDTYSGSGGAGGDYDNPEGLRAGRPKFKGSALADRKNKVLNANGQRMQQGQGWPLAKSLCLLPTLYPASLAYGRNLLDPDDTLDPWRIRNLIVWHRPNPPVGALGDKVRPSTSYVTTACVSDKRWFDLDAERQPGNSFERNGETKGRLSAARDVPDQSGSAWMDDKPLTHHEAGAPPLDCWTIPTAPYSGSHYATFPPALPRKLINLMCPRQVCVVCGEPRRRIVEAERHTIRPQHQVASMAARSNDPDFLSHGASTYTTVGWTDCGCHCGFITHSLKEPCSHAKWRRGVVLDPFAGSGTTLMAASELGRDSIGIDLDARNLALAQQRCGMFLTEAVS